MLVLVASSGSFTRVLQSRVFHITALAFCAAVLFLHTLQYNFITDDAYISFVYARNFAEHGALVFNPGDAVEGYTNFLWTFVLGLLMWLGWLPEVSSLVLAFIFASGTLYLVHRLTRYLTSDLSRGRSLWDYFPPLLLGLSSGFACWTSGGLETQMFTFWVTLALYSYIRADSNKRWYRWFGLACALAAMTRPEGMLVAAVLGLHRVGLNLLTARKLVVSEQQWLAFGTFVFVWLPYFGWRWWYYGHLFPNTYFVKATGAEHYAASVFDQGLFYLWEWARQTGVAYVVPLVVAGLVYKPGDWRNKKRLEPRFLFGSAAALLLIVYTLYVIRVGGDFLGLHRFIMPLFVVVAVAFVLGIRTHLHNLLSRLFATRLARKLYVGCALVLLAAFTWKQGQLTHGALDPRSGGGVRGIDKPAWLITYTEDRAAIGRHMRGCFRDTDFSIVGGAGAQPYYGRMRAVDVFGLVSWDIGHCQPRIKPRPGHNKWGERGLLLKQPRRDGHKCPPIKRRFDKKIKRGDGSVTSVEAISYDWQAVDGGPPDFLFHCYAIHAKPRPSGFNCRIRHRDYELVTLHIPQLRKGNYYSFYKHKRRTGFQCPGLQK